MKVRVKTAFKDKNTDELYKIGDELEMSVQRVNEVLKVGNFIELVELDNEHTEQPDKTPDQKTDGTDEGQDGANQNDAGQETGETPKQTGRRKRTNK